MGCAGFVVLGFISAALTIWVYGLGSWIGAPAGFVLGGLLGSRSPFWHCLAIWSAALLGGWIGRSMVSGPDPEGFTQYVCYLTGFTLAALLALGICRVIADRQKPRRGAIPPPLP